VANRATDKDLLIFAVHASIFIHGILGKQTTATLPNSGSRLFVVQFTNMESSTEKNKTPSPLEEKVAGESSSEIGGHAAVIFVDPVKEKAALRKFDKIFLPQAFVFLVLNYLDRSNVSLQKYE
jgi:hypothetical protein